MRLRSLTAAFAVTLAFSPSAYAQDTGAGARPHEDHSPRGMVHGPRRANPDPVLLKGPPQPEEFTRITGLEESKRPRYAELYQSFMAKTRPQRDSLKTSLDTIRQALQSGGRSSARGHRSSLRELRGRLADQQREFNDSVKKLLSSSEWNKYQQWREAERDRMRKEWRERRHRA